MPDFPLPMLALAPLRRKVEQQGNREFSPDWAGQAAPLGREMPAAVLTRALADAALQRFRQLVGSVFEPNGVTGTPNSREFA